MRSSIAKPRSFLGRSCSRACCAATTDSSERTDDSCNRITVDGCSGDDGGLPVIIVGGGIGGLTLGVALSRANVPFIVLESATKLRRESGNGIGLWGPAQMVLRALGLEKTVQPSGRYMECAGYRAAHHTDGEWLLRPSQPPQPSPASLLSVRTAVGLASRRLRSCLCIRRAALQEALVAEVPPSSLRLGSRVCDVFVAGDGSGNCVACLLYTSPSPRDRG